MQAQLLLLTLALVQPVASLATSAAVRPPASDLEDLKLSPVLGAAPAPGAGKGVAAGR